MYTLESLKSGMITETKDGGKYIYLNGIFMSQGRKYYLSDTLYHNDLTSRLTERYDIVKVYNTKSTNLNDLFNDDLIVLVWERENN